ncbi:MAG: entericidin A/B family lipoprotein [Betaproteobacteria bacterium]|nr:entericidin A/B family lipoprotein [Betaproteobacteria bacterium]
MELGKIISLFLIALFCVACNTVQGVGKDVQKGGEAIERAGKK